MPLLQEISNWSIEAKDEDTNRYFFHFDDVSAIENGRKRFVVGRKGSGKTAIAEFLHNRKGFNVFTRKLSFKNFPFNLLYTYADKNFTPPNQYISVWQYVIYHCICSMLVENEKTYSTMDKNLRKVLDIDIEHALHASVQKITSKSYGLTLMGLGGERGIQTEEGTFRLYEGIAILEKFIKNHMDDSSYYIIFDELDEDYKDVLDPDRKDKYFELLIGLFKAVQIVRSSFKENRIFPVVFIRDDILELCRDPDKNKWLDSAVNLTWSSQQLKRLILFRIQRANNSEWQPGSLQEAWELLFSVNTTRYGRAKKHSKGTFEYIVSCTFQRPRDVINYVRQCARLAIDNEVNHIDNEIISEADSYHSEYLKREIVDEVHPVLDDISEILNVLSELGHPIFSKRDFDGRFRSALSNKEVSGKIQSSEVVLQLLYRFNVIGNFDVGGQRIFSYNSSARKINFRKRICIHRGLLKELRVG